MPSTCAACGARSDCLAVHLLLGKCDGEAACSCPEADEIRQRWGAEVDDLYTAHATSHPAAAPSSSVAFNWWRAAPGEEEDSDDDNDEDMQGPGPAVAGGRRSRCVIS